MLRTPVVDKTATRHPQILSEWKCQVQGSPHMRQRSHCDTTVLRKSEKKLDLATLCL